MLLSRTFHMTNVDEYCILLTGKVRLMITRYIFLDYDILCFCTSLFEKRKSDFICQTSIIIYETKFLTQNSLLVFTKNKQNYIVQDFSYDIIAPLDSQVNIKQPR